MRRMLMLVGLTALLAVPLVGSAGATGGLLGGGDVEVGVEPVCKSVLLPATGGLDVAVEKKITLAGKVYNVSVNKQVVRVVKTIRVRVCVGTDGDVKANVGFNVGEVKPTECHHGHGAVIHVPATQNAGAGGGAVVASVEIAVSDQDMILHKEIEFEKVIEKHVRREVPPSGVDDTDAVDAFLCVDPKVGD